MEYNDEFYNLLRYAGKLRAEDTFYYPMQYILKNLRSIAAMSIYDLADASFVSAASISRMCRDLGYKTIRSSKSAYTALTAAPPIPWSPIRYSVFQELTRISLTRPWF